MRQTRIGSFIEALMNIAIGYIVAILSQLAIFPMFGIHVSITTNLWIGAWFTAISLVRSYVIRRWFNARLHRAAHSVARAAQHEKQKECKLSLDRPQAVGDTEVADEANQQAASR